MGDYTDLDVVLTVKPELLPLMQSLEKAERSGDSFEKLTREFVKTTFGIDHEFFDKGRNMYFIHPEQFTSPTVWHVKAYLKKYESEIETFFDWVKDYVVEEDGNHVGEVTRPYYNQSDNVFWRNGKLEIVDAPYDSYDH
jgi:predicted urease superfamily metal-dependent hydrolase